MTTEDLINSTNQNEVRSGNGKNNGKFKNQILNRLRSGKETLLSVERHNTKDLNLKGFQNIAGKSKANFRKIKYQIEHFGNKIEQFIERNPKKAVAFAASVGLLAGSLWSGLRRKRPSPSKKR